ncbi:MAG: S41 family peptidase [Hyphomicrobiales bacterium]
MKKILKTVLIALPFALACLVIYALYYRYTSANYRLSDYTNDQAVDHINDSVFSKSKYSYTPKFTDFSDEGKIFYYIKTWGFLKYHSSFNDDIDWDEIFLQNILKVSQLNFSQFNQLLSQHFALLNPIKEKTIKNKESDYALIDNTWFDDTLYLDHANRNNFTYIFQNYKRLRRYGYATRIGKIVFNQEDIYGENCTTEKNYQLLSLARYWNIINYFYVYKNITDYKWDDVLLMFIPKFYADNSQKQYKTIIAQLIEYIDDSHSMMRGDIYDSIFGSNKIPYQLKIINDTAIVSKAIFQDTSSFQLLKGDIILAFDTVPINKKINTTRRFFRKSNPNASNRSTAFALVSTFKQKINVKIMRDNKISQHLISAYDYNTCRKKSMGGKKKIKQNSLAVYNSNTAYLKLYDINNDNEQLFDSAIQYPNVIFDMRGYPHSMGLIKAYEELLPRPVSFYRGSYANIACPGMLKYAKESYNGICNEDYYKGNVYILVNEYSQSMSEFLIMLLQQNPNAITIGSQTAGADGNVTKIRLPDDLLVLVTGIGIFYPDLSMCQRVGVKIDHTIYPTTTGIKNNIDEVLKYTLQLINS